MRAPVRAWDAAFFTTAAGGPRSKPLRPRGAASAVGTVGAGVVLAGCSGSAVPTSPPPAGAATADSRIQAHSARASAGVRWIDLTHSFDAATIYWPTERGFEFERSANGPTSQGYYYAANRFATAEHGGTHLDAPRHLAEGRHTADQVEPERLVGEAVVIDVTAKCAADAGYEVTAALWEFHGFAWPHRNSR